MRLASFALILLAACSRAPSIPRVDAMEAAGLVRNQFAILVDVREESDVKKAGAAEGAKWLPLSAIRAKNAQWNGFVNAQPKDKQLIVYGSSGSEAKKAAEALAEAGMKTGVLGEFDDWKKAGLPVRPAAP